ncbi:UDP-Glycosyltransferase/glycogen phosphorylase [Trametes versicolor FP-101664 SS1]|uniref:UDP-Glycosyltransferase/glycogen phosphorylase n=1 Tax=Trametes versicolor (strain FP-101664) TaxID=717944 RepID=UPI00046224EA|nr:UDP-Glycosyltransferase/glycogen phosphorylase [Trametes versicolor FP-101664 SS1]EIW63015.1 UDP-Glycosyltransferase/glycogen phosphorylase [Trametes versicolor FP-101664 SS1]
MSQTRAHIVAYPFPAWGHARPLINLVARLVKLRALDVTLLVTDDFLDQAFAELRRNMGPDEQEHTASIRILSLGAGHFSRLAELDKAFEETWTQLVTGEEAVCRKTGTRIAPLQRPQAIIVDMFGIQAFGTVMELSGDTVKVHVWCSGLTAAMFHLFGPEELGGKGNVRARAEEEARQTGVSLTDIIMRVRVPYSRELVRVPGMPPMYDYEYYPQPVSPLAMFSLSSWLHRMLEACDGMLLYTSEAYESEAVAAMREWFGKTSRGIYVTGPLVPIGVQTTGQERERSEDADKIQAFLDSTLATFGERSLLYISFGTMLHGEDVVEKLWALLDIVMELNIPFVMSHASSPGTDIPDDAKAKIDAYSKGLLSPWVPQQTLLEHTATGWFLTHGGHNSAMEAVVAGVPMIFWPFGADQPLTTVHVTDNLHAGYELIETRSGPDGLKPIYRNGRQPLGTVEALKAEVREVLQKAFGEDGGEKRKNLPKISSVVRCDWEEGGAAKRDISVFLSNL